MLFCKYITESISNSIVFNVWIVMFLELTNIYKYIQQYNNIKTNIYNNLKLPQLSPPLWFASSYGDFKTSLPLIYLLFKDP